MKIIELGGRWSKKIKCKACDTLMEIEAEDLRYGFYTYNYESEDIAIGKYYVICPNTHCEKVLEQKDVPAKIQEETKENRSDSA